MCWICFEYWIKLSSILSHHSNLPSFFNLINDLQTNWKYSWIKTERQLTWESQSTVYRVSKKNQNLTRFEEKKSNGNWQTNLHQAKLSFAKVDCIWIFLIKLQSQCINIDERVAKLLTSTKSNVWINEKVTPQVWTLRWNSNWTKTNTDAGSSWCWHSIDSNSEWHFGFCLYE